MYDYRRLTDQKEVEWAVRIRRERRERAQGIKARPIRVFLHYLSVGEVLCCVVLLFRRQFPSPPFLNIHSIVRSPFDSFTP